MEIKLTEDILSLLVGPYPESIRIENIFGQLPVDCYRGSDSNIHRILTPLEQNQEITSVRPLQQQPQQRQRQQQQQEETQNTGSLLFELLKNNASYDEVKTILQKQPEAVQQQNKDGFLPLHMSLRHGTSAKHYNSSFRSVP
jgi:ankyrin repeat protein